MIIGCCYDIMAFGVLLLRIMDLERAMDGSRCLIMNENDVEMVYKIDPLYQSLFISAEA
jgi:hypothetical protein